MQPQQTQPQQTSTKREPKQPDITLLEGGKRRSGKYPDLVTGKTLKQLAIKISYKQANDDSKVGVIKDY